MSRLRIIVIVAIATAAAALGAWQLRKPGHANLTFRTEPAVRGDLAATVNATGTVEPEEVIDVGSQVAGMIKEFGLGADGEPIDYRSPVEPGTVLVRIDDSIYKAKVDQGRAAVRSAEQTQLQSKAKVDEAKAAVAQARANTQRTDADLRQVRAKADQSDKDWVRAQALRATNSISQSDYDAAKSLFDANTAAIGVATAAVAQSKAAEVNAAAMVADAEAAVGVAEAAVATAKAQLSQDEINLGYCTIKSSVKGTIIDRRVTIGQTVQSSFNTPSLFLIAKDLTRIVVWASVNEADISRVQLKQNVTFTVDGLPDRKFAGTVKRIRLNATNTQNVVVYTVEVVTDNADGALLPYMTANLQVEIEKRKDARLVPNAALRYRPSAAVMANADAAGDKSKDKARNGTVWVQEGGRLKAVDLKLGISDGNFTEVLEGDLEPGTPLVVGEAVNGAATESGQNPFAPKLGGKK